MFRSRIFGWLLLLALVGSAAEAADLDQIVKDFKPLSGYVVMPIGNEFLIDLDGSDGVAVSDLFSVITPGEKIIHPISKKMIGTLDEVKGILKVTRVKSGYSYAKPMGSAENIAKGDMIRRYENLMAIFWDYTGQGEPFFNELSAALPNLEWQSYAASQSGRPAEPSVGDVGNAALVFVMTAQGIQVCDADFAVIHSYPMQHSISGKSEAPTVAPAMTVPVAPPQKNETIVFAPSQPAIEKEASGIVETGIVKRENLADLGIWVSPPVREELVGIEVADLDGDGQLETAMAYPHQIQIARLLNGVFTTISSVDIGKSYRALRLDGADLNGDGKQELYLTASLGQDLSSMVIAEQDGQYQITSTNIPWYLRAVDLPGEGRVLLGQTAGGHRNDFDGPVFRVKETSTGIDKGEPVTSFGKINIFGFLPFADGNGTYLTARFSAYDYLQVYTPQGEKLWESMDQLGGSTTFIERIDPAKNPASGDDTQNVFLDPRLEFGDNGELLVPANEGMRWLARYRSYKDSKLIAMKWDGRELREVWHTKGQKGYMADFRFADIDNDGKKEIVQGLVSTGSGMAGYVQSSRHVFEM